MEQGKVKFEVAANGAVTIHHGTAMVSMSRFSHAASVIASELGEGTHVYDDTFHSTTENPMPADVWDAAKAVL